MPVELAHPAWLAALAVLPALGLVWRLWPAPFGRHQRRAALAVRLVLFVALVLALAGPSLTYTSPRQTLVVAAQRSRGSAPAQSQEISDVAALARHLPGRDEMGVVSFGQNALVEDPPERKLGFSGFATSPNPNYTDIESALQLSASLAAAGTRRHVVLVSDGRQNVGDAVGEARALRSQGVRVDVLPLHVHIGPDVRVDSVQVPSSVPASSKALATAVIASNEKTTARVQWSLDNTRVVLDKVVAVKPGISEVRAVLPPAGPGFHQVSVQVTPARDSVPGNNTGEALFQVLGRQRVLVVQGHPGAGANVAEALRAAGIAADVVNPTEVPVTVGGVARWQSVALVDVSARQLGPERMQAIASATRDLGVGLAAFGGTDTFGPGGFSGTPLERALPIEMKVANEELKPPIAVMLVLETVESNIGDEVVRSAARQLVANLSPDDLVGVTNGMSGVVVPLQRVGNGKKVESEIGNIPDFGDPPSYVPYMQDAAGVLGRYPADSKYIVLMGDGDADFPLPSPSFMSGLVRGGITVSTVGADVHGSPLFMSYMAQIASEGNGRFYDSESASQLPSIFLDETQVQLQPWIVQQRFHVVAGVPTPALDGVDPQQIPPLDGYVASTAKPASEVALSGPYGDPILAQWQYGLGTATAWTSDTEGRWTSALLRSPLGGKLLAGVVASTLPLQADPSLSVSAQIEGDVAHVVAQVNTALPANASAVAHVVGPAGTGSEVALAETAPGRFEGDIPTTQVGSYLMRVQVSSGKKVLHAATAGVALAYSPELRYMGTDMALLRQVAKAGGGVVLRSPAEAFSVAVPPVNLSQSLWFALVLLAAVLLPLDVALRRLNLARETAMRGAGATAPAEVRVEALPAEVRAEALPVEVRAEALPVEVRAEALPVELVGAAAARSRPGAGRAGVPSAPAGTESELPATERVGARAEAPTDRGRAGAGRADRGEPARNRVRFGFLGTTGVARERESAPTRPERTQKAASSPKRARPASPTSPTSPASPASPASPTSPASAAGGGQAGAGVAASPRKAPAHPVQPAPRQRAPKAPRPPARKAPAETRKTPAEKGEQQDEVLPTRLRERLKR
ncbi:MAG: hypothetical protein M0005_16590 [Actinomycetota bacterium]|nr:hypothetical protein [Actinomycetota bacterium]